MSQRQLYVGLDLRDDRTHIAVLEPSQTEPDVLTVSSGEGEEETIHIRTEVTVPGSGDRIQGFVGKIVRQEEIYVEGRESDPVNILAAFLRKTLSLTKKKYPRESIKNLVVTTEYHDYRLISFLYRALEKLGIGRERAQVVGRGYSYIHYVMNQKKEFWINKVGMFEFRQGQLMYFEMQTDRSKRPLLVRVKEKDYSDYVELLTGSEHSEEEKASIFEGMVQGAIHGQIITSLYMTGEGFDDGFADDVMKRLCVGRHLFRGDNLHVCGACYMAAGTGDEKRVEEFIYLDEDTIPSYISIGAYTDAKEQEVLLAKAGTLWYQLDRELDLIPDGDQELELHIKNAATKEKTVHFIPMEGIAGRTGRKARIGVRIRFAGANRCIITIRDKGFGEFFPSSYRIWEETIML